MEEKKKMIEKMESLEKQHKKMMEIFMKMSKKN